MKKLIVVLILTAFLCGCISKDEWITFENGKIATINGENIKTFKRGEKIVVSFKNIGDKPIILPNSAPWMIYKVGKNLTPVYQPIALQVLIKLNPGESVKWEWNQRDFNGKLVESGLYEFVVKTTKYEFRKRFMIVD